MNACNFRPTFGENAGICFMCYDAERHHRSKQRRCRSWVKQYLLAGYYFLREEISIIDYWQAVMIEDVRFMVVERVHIKLLELCGIIGVGD